MHPLDAWLSKHGRTRQWLAAKLGVSEATLSRVIAGKQWPSRNLAAEIARITGGAITANDFLEGAA